MEFAVWFVRIRDHRYTNNTFDGILKIEKILVTEEQRKNGLDSEEVDYITASIINERIDIAKLNDDMQGFVFGDAIRAIYNLQLGQYGADDEYAPPSKIVIFIDELNKYASTDTPKSSPILRQVLDVAERGRSLGIILFAAEQFKSNIHTRVTGNCSTFAFGRTNAIEIAKK